MESKACPCGRVLYEDVRHCPSCGRPMSAARRATAEEKRFGQALAACRLGNGPSSDDDPEDRDESGRDLRCAICEGDLCIHCHGVDDACEHDTDQRHGWRQ